MNTGETIIVPTQAEKAELFRALHEGPEVLLLPNPWDVGSAKLLTWLGFAALATTSSGFAATLGRLDGSVTRDEALAPAAGLAAARSGPVRRPSLGRPGERLRRRARRRRRDHPDGGAGRPGRLLGRRLHRRTRVTDLRHRARRRPGRGGRGGREGRPGPAGDHRAGRELPARPAGSG